MNLRRLCFLPALAIASSGARADDGGSKDVAVLVETFELEANLSKGLGRADSNDPDLRTRVEAWTEEGKAELADCTYFRVENLKALALESRLEIMFGTEGDPPEAPTQFSANSPKGKRLEATDSTFTAFETDFAGFWFETQPRVSAVVREGSILPGAVLVESTEPRERMVALSGALLVWSVLKEKVSLAADPEDPLQQPLADKWLPHFTRARVGNDLTLAHGRCELVHIAASPKDPAKRALVFATAWVLRNGD